LGNGPPASGLQGVCCLAKKLPVGDCAKRFPNPHKKHQAHIDSPLRQPAAAIQRHLSMPFFARRLVAHSTPFPRTIDEASRRKGCVATVEASPLCCVQTGLALNDEGGRSKSCLLPAHWGGNSLSTHAGMMSERLATLGPPPHEKCSPLRAQEKGSVNGGGTWTFPECPAPHALLVQALSTHTSRSQTKG
jgi:hypothetical protein